MKFNQFWSLLGPYKKHAVVLFFLMLGSALFEALGVSIVIPLLDVILNPDKTAPAVTLPVVKTIQQQFSQSSLFLIICLVVVAIFILKNAILYARSVFTTFFMNSLRIYWSRGIFEAYLKADYNTIISSDRGELLNNSFNEPVHAAKMVGQAIEYATKALIVLCIYVVMLIYTFKITLIISAVIFFILGIIWVLSTSFSISKGEIRISLNQQINTNIEQALNGIRQVKIFSLETGFLKKVVDKYDNLRKVLVDIALVQNLPTVMGEILIVCALVVWLLFIRYRTDISTASVLPTIAFITIASQRLYQNLSAVVSGRVILLSLLPSLRLISQLFIENMLRERPKRSHKESIDSISGDILFENVTFSHDGLKPIFHNLNLSIPKNKTTAIIGESGSGKSTMVDLLTGLYKGYSGNILIGRYNLDSICLQSWRKIIGYVSQDVFLFNLSIKENIILAKPTATEDEVESAARKAYAHDFIKELPDGYNTVLGDRGQKVSRGQAQRITLARAIINDPEVYIFDEATSALDVESERKVQRFIDDMKGRKTIIMIAHRLSTIEHADVIYHIKNGKLIET